MTKIPPHRHCPVCGKPVPIDARTCSGRCEKAFDRTLQNRRIFYSLMVVLVAIWAIFMLFYAKGKLGL